MPTGTLTNSTHRQSSRSVRIAPASTPIAAPLAAVADQARTARRRSAWAVKVVVSRLSVAGASTAAAVPCRARAVISHAAFCASAPSRLNAVNRPTASRNTRRRPNRSAARPPSISKPAKVSV